MQQKKRVYGLLGAALALVFAGIAYLLFVERDMESLSVDKTQSPDAPADQPKPYKPDLSALKKRKALVKEALGENPELLEMAKGIENREFKNETRIALVQTLALHKEQSKALAQMLRLLGALEKSKPDAEVRESIVFSLGRFVGHERARLKLIESLSPPTMKSERIQAMLAIREHSANWVQPHLAPIAENDPDEVIREQARRTLAVIAKRSMRKR